MSNQSHVATFSTKHNLSSFIHCIYTVNRPAMIHFSTIRYVSRYSCHDMKHDTIRYITTKQEGYCLVSCSWAQKSVQLTSLVGSTHAFVVSAILNIMLNTAQHGFFLSVCSENRRAYGLQSGRVWVSTN